MVSGDGRAALVYNGELYNDAQLRAELEQQWSFRSDSDSETLLAALSVWGEEAIPKLRGMFAFAFVDRDRERVLLSRDPLGVKPLYAAEVTGANGRQLVFGSEPPAVLAHPDMRTQPDMVTVSAYLTTIRPTLGRRTMFEGLETLEPGETRMYDVRSGDCQTVSAWDALEKQPQSDPLETRDAIEQSIRAHLRTDVPMCSLLSGGLDSAIVTRTVRNEHDALSTYCAGAKLDGFDNDLAFAARLARTLDVNHTEVLIDGESFGSRWISMVESSGMPMSTPNEVAIYSVARALRGEGHIVAMSGEGADELFGGYAAPMRQAAAHVAGLEGAADTDGGLFHLRSNAWISGEVKARVLRSDVIERAGSDEELRATYRRAFDRCREDAPRDSGLQAHLRFLRRVNLENLLRRLDSATMLASVEGRTPFADIRVARFAEALPMASKFVDGDPPGTKLALREAFKSVLPGEIVARPKASFPLPFEGWMGGATSVLRKSKFAHALFNTEAIQTVGSSPQALWNLAWPMLNIALWGERWWGDGAPSHAAGKHANASS